MLLLPLKVPYYFDLQTSLADWLDSDTEVSFQQTPNADADSGALQFVMPKPNFGSAACKTELQRLNALRKGVSDSILKADGHKAALEDQGLEDTCELHAALLQFEMRGFPTLDDEANGLNLTWKGAFGVQQKETHHTLVWDRACCLWNTAALYSQKIQTLSTTEGGDRDAIKMAISCCQTSASLLQLLQELSASQDFATVEMSKPMLTFWNHLFLAQAQTYIYQLASSNDTARHNLLSQLSASAFKLFNDALHWAQDPRLQSEVPKYASEWGAYCKAHSMLASAKSEYHQAVLHRQEREWGKEIARLKVCLDKLDSCHDFVRTTAKIDNDDPALLELKRQVDTYLPFVKDRYHTAYEDNLSVYQDEVPHAKELEEIEPKQLAKSGLELPESMQTPRVPLFQKL